MTEPDNTRHNPTIQLSDRQIAAIETLVASGTQTDAAYAAGEATLNTVLLTQRQRIAVERALVKQSFEVMRAMCALRKAVGGSFDAELDRIPEFTIESKPITIGANS